MEEKFNAEEICLSSLLGVDAHWNINKALVREFGLETAFILADLITKEDYFKIREELDEEGYFFNTQKNLEDDLGLSPHSQRKALDKLKEKEIIFVKLAGSPARNFYKINKIQLLKILTTSSQKFSQLDVKNFNYSLYNKNKVKRIKKATGEELSPDVPKVIEAFSKVDPKNKEYYGRADMRKASHFLISEYGLDKVIGVIENLPLFIETIPYFPSISNPKELKENWTKAKNAFIREELKKKQEKRKSETKKTPVSI